jgi:periplasmic protein CpxP/Spy
MKASLAIRLGVVIAALFAAGAAGAQAPGASGNPAPAGPGFGGHRPPMERALGGDHGKWWNNPTMVEKLQLTDDQRKAMDGILQQHREQLIDLRANLEKAELALEPLMRDDQPNESAVFQQIDKVAQTRAELEKANARFLFALRSKLTPDQWKQVQEFRSSRENTRRDFGRGPRRQGGDQSAPPPPPPPGPQGLLDGGPVPEGPADAGAPPTRSVQ